MSGGKNMSPVWVDEARLWESHMEMARIGATPKGGVNRQALTAEDGEARALLSKWGREAGCEVLLDTMGNLYLRRPGKNPTLNAVCTGSHLDTQPTGGKFDGAYGVLAGLEVIRRLNDLEIETVRPIELVAWTNEEGTRFSHGGSAVYAKKETLQTAYNECDPQGIRFEEALDAINAKGSLPCGDRSYDSVFEVHIEQGPVLEAKELQVGIVSGARGQSRYDVTVLGQDGHAGTLPMPMRRDALCATARLVTGLERIGLDHPPQGVCTVGALTVTPNSRNVVPGRVEFAIDLRHPTAEGLASMEARIAELMAPANQPEGIEVTCRHLDREDPITFDTELLDLLKAASKDLNLPFMDIFSMAGHDACYVSALQPTAMVFVPCKDGLSHNELEDALPADLAAGASVLANAMLARANQ